MTDHDARLGRIGNRHRFRGSSLLAAYEQPGGDRTRRERARWRGHGVFPFLRFSERTDGAIGYSGFARTAKRPLVKNWLIGSLEQDQA
jgi:hypothetical protein